MKIDTKVKINLHEEKHSPAILTETKAAQFKQKRQTAQSKQTKRQFAGANRRFDV